MYELVFVAISVAIAAYFLRKDRNPGNIPPGPEQSLFLGNFKDVDTNKMPQSLHTLSKTYGPLFSLRLLTKRIIVFNSAELIRKAFQSDEFKELFNDKPQGFYGTYLIYGHQDVLFGPYKDVTFKIKAIMYKGLQSLHSEDHIRSEVADLVKLFGNTAGCDFDPLSIIEKTMTDLHTKALKGDVLPDDGELIMDFARSSSALLQVSTEAKLKLFPFLRHMNINVGCQYKTAIDCRKRMMKRFFHEQKTTFSPKVTRGLVDTCLHVQSSEKNPDGSSWLTDEIIKAILIDIIGGGVITTTQSLLSTVLCLAHNPECQKKMQTEIDKVIGNGRNPNGSDVTKLQYCHAVLLESFRHNSVVPLVNHCCSVRDVEFEGYCIPKGSILFGCFWSANYDETVWIDPHNFRPERFLDDKGKLLSVDHKLRKSLFPYGIGARMCVGKSIAHIRLLVYITAIVQHFNILPPDDTELLSNDPKLFKPGPVLQVPNYQCRMVARTRTSS